MKNLFAPTNLRLWLLLYPFTAAAVAINLFLLFLMLQVFGVSVLAPLHALLAAVPLGVPANSMVAAWVTRLINEAEGRSQG
ncbi:hypothetical protein [Shimia aestuarii]|uniref:hypothetical protein n=1 Tax=Shimia aestuarii TaxID=254406 RepID=UPI001FB1B395|nr:hypothetical protein [Shimia aestuarii]